MKKDYFIQNFFPPLVIVIGIFCFYLLVRPAFKNHFKDYYEGIRRMEIKQKFENSNYQPPNYQIDSIIKNGELK